jgi:1,4-alpha-glucan branching enzyme
MIRKRPSDDPNKLIVRFELPSAIWAESLHLVGDFDGCNQTSHLLMRDRVAGTWHITLELERGKEFQFRYLVNGREWHNDWQADKYVPNPDGGACSVVSTMPPLTDEGQSKKER